MTVNAEQARILLVEGQVQLHNAQARALTLVQLPR
jgi:hypothetical protein